MNRNLRLVIDNNQKEEKQKYFFEKKELKIILNLYAKMVSKGSWKDYGLSNSNKQVSFNAKSIIKTRNVNVQIMENGSKI